MRLYRRGKRGIWWVDFTVAGRPRFERSTGTTDEAAAREWAAKAQSDQWRQRRLGEPPSVTWDEAALAWLSEHKHLRAIEEAKRNLRWLTKRLTGTQLSSITAEVVRRIAAERAGEPANAAKIAAAKAAGKVPPTPRKLAGATINRYLSDLSRVMQHAYRLGYLPSPPPVAKLHEPQRRITWLTRDQARDLLAELPDHLRAMAAFALATGLRESNVRLLEWAQVDSERRVAWVSADQAKAGRALSVPLNDVAIAVLEHQQGIHTRWVFPVPRWLEKRRDDDAPRQIWDSPTGKISNHAWRKACIRAGVPTLRFHDLRHTWASWHIQAGTPPAVLKELGGWASLTMVERYAHLAPGHVAAWAGNIGHATITRQVQAAPESENGPEGPRHEGDSMGWLMGLEPTTTRITRPAGDRGVLQINDLRARRKRRTG